MIRGVEEECAEDWDVKAVRQDSQVGFGELEGWRMLLEDLPHTLKEKQEHWRNILSEGGTGGTKSGNQLQLNSKDYTTRWNLVVCRAK